MRFFILAALTLATFVFGTGTGSAREYPWCLIGGDSGAWSCGYDSFEQCMANRRGTAMCNGNPRYQSASAQPRKGQRARPQ